MITNLGAAKSTQRMRTMHEGWFLRVLRADGQEYRFTTVDQEINLARLHTGYSPHPGVRVSSMRREAGVKDRTIQVTCLLDDVLATQGGITYEDVRMGRLRGGRVQMRRHTFKFPWWGQTHDNHVWWILEADVDGYDVVLRLAGLTSRLKNRSGAFYSRSCQNELAVRDIRNGGRLVVSNCPVRTNAEPWRYTGCGTSSVSSRRKFQVTNANFSSSATPDDWFAFGYIVAESGPLQGFEARVLTSSFFPTPPANRHLLELAAPLPLTPSTETWRVVVGCDKTAPTCLTKFNPTWNSYRDGFRGHEQIPGFDRAVRGPLAT